MRVIAEPPIMHTIEGDLTGRKRDVRIVEMGRYQMGKFVVCADGETAQLYGALYYGEACKKLNQDRVHLVSCYAVHGLLEQALGRTLPGITLGGGILQFDGSTMSFSGRSERFGNVPRCVLESTLDWMPETLGFSADVTASDAHQFHSVYNNDEAHCWYRERGIDVSPRIAS